MRLVHDHEVPAHLPQSGQHIGALGQIERGDDAVALQPLIDAELLADVLALQHHELGVEFLLQFPLPLESEVGRADDEDALGKAAKLQLADQESRHDGLSRACVVGEQKAHARKFQQVVVHRFELVRRSGSTREIESPKYGSNSYAMPSE
ncbi:MAG: hypothetical protein RML56_16030 [Burkholderiales bacterium]|nr:hypothetical protein [Burkholderiales bacterium]